jgi:DNA-binding HxlR family transcriptional regulator
LAAGSVNGSGNGARSGAQALTLLSSHRNCLVLRALEKEPRRQAELRRATGFPAQSTLRAQLKNLEEIGAIAKRRRDAFPGVLEYELERPGRELLPVASVLDRWLAEAPVGPLELDSAAARAAVKALVDGWSSSMLRVLAARPLSLTELDRAIVDLNYPSLERRLVAMRVAGLVAARPGDGRGTPYAVTEWARRGMAPLAAGIRWERRHAPQRTAAIRHLDVETGFLLAVPLLRPPAELSGVCRMAVEIPNGAEPRLAGILAEVEAGRVRRCSASTRGDSDAWVCGSATAWLAAVIDADADGLELGGDCRLARAILDGLHRALFGARSRRPSRVSN